VYAIYAEISILMIHLCFFVDHADPGIRVTPARDQISESHRKCFCADSDGNVFAVTSVISEERNGIGLGTGRRYVFAAVLASI
jgi:hypothetical protein